MNGNTDLHNREAAVQSPIRQAAWTGFILACLMAWAVWAFRIMDPLQWILGAFLIGFAGYWFTLQKHWLRLTTGPELNVSPVVEREPAKPARSLDVWIHHPRVGGMGKSEKVTFSATPETMVTLARGLLAGRPFTRVEWVQSGILSDDQHRKIVAEMLTRGLLRYKTKNPKNGTELTPEGRQVMESILESASPSAGSGTDADDDAAG